MSPGARPGPTPRVDTNVSGREPDVVGGANPTLSTMTRCGRVVASYVLVAFGISLLVRADVGVAPFDVLTTGLADSLGIRLGYAFLITSVVFYGTGVLLGGRTGWASLVGTVVIAPLLEMALAIVPEPDRLASRIPMFAIGVLVLVAGVCLVITTELGPGPGEVFMLGLIVRGMAVAPARWITDGVAFAAGLALGGAIGAGTVVFAFAFGPLVALGLRRLDYTPPTFVADAVVAP